jgi:hypothetical protein
MLSEVSMWPTAGCQGAISAVCVRSQVRNNVPHTHTQQIMPGVLLLQDYWSVMW